MSTLVLEHQYPYLHPITIQLPFERVTARAIIVRARDAALIGTKHHKGAKYALPGGGLNDGEKPTNALIRELNEENIFLHGIDEKWQERVALDYFNDYRELAFWYVMKVDSATIGVSENIETRWIYLHEDVWYPQMREKIMLHLRQYVPTLVFNFPKSY